MAVKKTKEQIMAEYGLNASNYSSQDLATYNTNPNAFIGISSNKAAYNRAKAAGDTAGMKQANNNANRIRSTYSQYTGGTDGLTYTPSPKYELDKPTYTSAYQGKINDALDKVLNRGEFSNENYNLKNDPVWQSLSKQYKYHGDLAYQDAIAGGAGKTGGYASSADKYTAQMAQNAYMQELNGFIPQLYEAAYNRYLNETKNMNDRLQLLRDIEAADYGRYRDDVSDWEKTRDYYNNNYMWQTERDDKLMQAAYENAMNKFNITGVADSNVADVLKMAEGTQTADERWKADSSKQAWTKINNDGQAQSIENAVKISNIMGFVPQQFAEVLGVDAGTPTSDDKYKQREYELAKYKAEKDVEYNNKRLEQDNNQFESEMGYKYEQMINDNKYRNESLKQNNEQFLQNMALDKAKFENDKNNYETEFNYRKNRDLADDTYRNKALTYEDTRLENFPEVYAEMMSSENQKQWLSENAKYISAPVLDKILEMIYSKKK